MNLPAIWETQFWSLGWEDPLEKGMATHSSILAWRIPWTEEPGGLQFMGSRRVIHNWVTNTHNHWDSHMEQLTGSKLGKEYVKAVYCQPANLTYMQNHKKFWTGWLTSWNQDCQEKYQQSQICRWYHSNGRKWRPRESLDESEKVDLKLNVQKMKIMASCPIPPWQMEKQRKQWKTIFLGSKITADGDCSHEINRRLLLRTKAMTNLDSLLKSRDIFRQQKSI